MLHVEQAPEQILQLGAVSQSQLLQSETADVKSDIWSLGKWCYDTPLNKKQEVLKFPSMQGAALNKNSRSLEISNDAWRGIAQHKSRSLEISHDAELNKKQVV